MATIEFALVVPILTTILLGIYDLGPSMMVRFKLASATQAAADLATQSALAQFQDFLNFFAAGSDVMAPYAGAPLNLRITNVASNGNGGAFVYWSCASGSFSPTAARSVVTSTPTGTALGDLLLLTNTKVGNYQQNGTNTSFVMVESTYSFTAPAGLIFKSAQNLSSTAFAVPRVSTYIGPTNGDPNYVPTPPTSVANVFNYAGYGISCSFAY